MIEHLLAAIGLWVVLKWAYKLFVTDPYNNKHWTME